MMNQGRGEARGSVRCDECNQAFTRNPDLIRHLEEKHQPPKECPAPSCFYSTRRADRLVKHIREKHPSEDDADADADPSRDSNHSTNIGQAQLTQDGGPPAVSHDHDRAEPYGNYADSSFMMTPVETADYTQAAQPPSTRFPQTPQSYPSSIYASLNQESTYMTAGNYAVPYQATPVHGPFTVALPVLAVPRTLVQYPPYTALSATTSAGLPSIANTGAYLSGSPYSVATPLPTSTCYTCDNSPCSCQFTS